MMTKAQFNERITDIAKWANNGCMDSGCAYGPKDGKPRMCTNGGCRCRPRDFSDALLDLAADLVQDGKYSRFAREP